MSTMNTPSDQPSGDLAMANSTHSDQEVFPATSLSAQRTQPVVQQSPLRDALAALKPQMHQAFVLMTQGASAKTITETVGLGRTTLFMWKKYNPKFRAALNAWHQDQVESTQLGVVAILPDCLETIREEVKRNANLAFKVVDKAGGFTPPPTGSISPRQMRKQIKLELRREKLRMRRRLEKIHLQEINQRAQEAEDRIEADRLEKIRNMDPAEVNRIRDYNARIERLAAQLREARKHDPDYKLDENYVRAVLNPEEFQKSPVVEKLQQPPKHQQPQQQQTDEEDDSDDEEDDENLEDE